MSASVGGRGRRRRRLGVMLQEAGLGPLRRVHRSYAPLEPLMVVGAFTVTFVLIFAFALNSAWQWIFYALFALTAGLVAYRRYGPTGNPAGRQWVGVGDGGVAVIAQRAEPVLFAWPAITERVDTLNEAQQLVRTEIRGIPASGVPTSVMIRVISDRKGLMEALNTRRPTPAPVTSRILITALVAAPLALLGWVTVVPTLTVGTEEELPISVALLGDSCKDAGVRYPAASPYTGPPPHPVVLFGAPSFSDLYPVGSEWNPTDPRKVQVLACLGLTGEGPARAGDGGQTCRYTGPNDGKTFIMRTGQFRLDVFELRTHRRLASHTISGDDFSCPERIPSYVDELYSQVTPDTLKRLLEPVVIG